MSYFNTEWTTELTVDASPVGLGAVLAQIDPNNPKNRRVVTFASRMLSEVERRYSQVEKEALAAVWGCERLYLYLCGRSFRLVTDNRAVELIFKNPKSDPPLRIKRWALRLMGFDYEIIHRPGAANIADYLSRHPVEADDPTRQCDQTENFIAFISEHALPKAMTRAEILEHTAQDETLIVLKDILNGSGTVDEKTKNVRAIFAKVLDEITITSDGLIMRGSRLILPEALHTRALMIAHEGHQGITKTKSLLRTKVWFPGMDKMTEETIGDCLACQLNSSSQAQPLNMTQMPEKAWDYLAIDFYGPLPNGKELLVIMDECSRFPIVEEVNTTSSEHVLPKLDSAFSMLGIPSELKSDNGPPFNGQKFTDFTDYYGIKHRKVTPEHPMANGLAENFMKNLGKVIRSSKVENRSWRQAMNEFLRNYRSTPHSSTGVAPATLLFGENRTNRLPTISEQSKEMKDYHSLAKANDSRAKSKAKEYADKKGKPSFMTLKLAMKFL